MQVHRLVFRLDFPQPNFDIIDNPGAVMRVFSEMGEKYWPEYKDDSSNRRVSVTKVDEEEGIFRQMSVEPTASIFSFESVKGLDINSFDTNETLITLFKGIHLIRDSFSIKEVQRAGIRFTILSNIKKKEPDLKSLFATLFDTELLTDVTSNLGEIKDFGLSFDGEAKDRLSYHCRFGPYEASEAKKNFTSSTANEMQKSGIPANLIFDLDLFETNFSMAISASKWSKVPIQKARQLTAGIEEHLNKKLKS